MTELHTLYKKAMTLPKLISAMAVAVTEALQGTSVNYAATGALTETVTGKETEFNNLLREFRLVVGAIRSDVKIMSLVSIPYTLITTVRVNYRYEIRNPVITTLFLPAGKEGDVIAFIDGGLVDDTTVLSVVANGVTYTISGTGFSSHFYYMDDEWVFVQRNDDLLVHVMRGSNANGTYRVGPNMIQQFVRTKPGNTVPWPIPWPDDYRIIQTLVSSQSAKGNVQAGKVRVLNAVGTFEGTLEPLGSIINPKEARQFVVSVDEDSALVVMVNSGFTFGTARAGCSIAQLTNVGLSSTWFQVTNREILSGTVIPDTDSHKLLLTVTSDKLADGTAGTKSIMVHDIDINPLTKEILNISAGTDVVGLTPETSQNGIVAGEIDGAVVGIVTRTLVGNASIPGASESAVFTYNAGTKAVGNVVTSSFISDSAPKTVTAFGYVIAIGMNITEKKIRLTAVNPSPLSVINHDVLFNEFQDNTFVNLDVIKISERYFVVSSFKSPTDTPLFYPREMQPGSVNGAALINADITFDYVPSAWCKITAFSEGDDNYIVLSCPTLEMVYLYSVTWTDIDLQCTLVDKFVSSSLGDIYVAKSRLRSVLVSTYDSVPGYDDRGEVTNLYLVGSQPAELDCMVVGVRDSMFPDEN